MKKIALALLLMYSTVAHAQSACENPKNDFDDLYCLIKLYQEADKELNDSYKKLAGKLDKKGTELLKETQLAWIRDRNDSCSRYENGNFFVNMRCATDYTIERSRFLDDRLRECASAGCQNSKL